MYADFQGSSIKTSVGSVLIILKISPIALITPQSTKGDGYWILSILQKKILKLVNLHVWKISGL